MILIANVLIAISSITGLMEPPIYPECHEDEVLVQVKDGEADFTNLIGTYGCVPGDNLPVTGYRP